jgi:hypothetical protein|nr:MAG TPA: hypothetical protein [Caudoviricetes sp.]
MKPVMHVFAFDTYDDMINSNDLHTNCLVFTLGKEQPGDGLGDIYYLVENEKVNKYTSIGELLRTDSMFRASKIELGPEVNTRRIAEDAKYHTRSLMNSTSSNVNNRMDEAINAMEEVKKETLAKYYETNEKLRAKNILLENTINELLSRIEYLEGTLGVNPNDHKKATEPVIPSTVAVSNTEEKTTDVVDKTPVDEEPSSEKTEDTGTNKKSKKGDK